MVTSKFYAWFPNGNWKLGEKSPKACPRNLGGLNRCETQPGTSTRESTWQGEGKTQIDPESYPG